MSEVVMPQRIKLACGSSAYFDQSSGISYRCEDCMAVVGSIGMPQRCKDEESKWKVSEILGGRGWDYGLGDSDE